MFITVAGYIFLAGMTWKGNKDAQANSDATIAAIQTQHDRENLDHRVTVLEQIASDNRENFSDIKDTVKAIFQRLNNMTDGHR